jgi:glycosyltransferase involved in cell wall biosynthesis
MLESKQSNKRILYLLFNPPPSARVRATIYKEVFNNLNVTVTYYDFYSILFSKILANKFIKNILPLKNSIHLINNFILILKEKYVLNISKNYDGIVLIKYVNPVFLKKLRNSTNSKILYDFDDSMWLDSFVGNEVFKEITRNVDYISCDNYYLKDKAIIFNKNTFIQKGPTNVELYNPVKKKSNKNIIIGWLGSPGTLFYLYGIYNVLESISKKYENVTFRIIGSGENFNNYFNFENVRVETVSTYNEKTMIEELHKMDIGVFPLFKNDMSLGRGSLKATIYMSFKIPVVAQAIGNNLNIIEHGVNGYLANSDEDWVHSLSILIDDKNTRELIAENAYAKMKEEYTVLQCFKEFENNYLNKI